MPRFLFIFFLCLSISTLRSEEEEIFIPPPESYGPPFALLTVSKCGTNMLMKCCDLLQKRSYLWIHKAIGIPQRNIDHFPKDMREIDAKMDSLLDHDHYLVSHAQLTYPVERLMNRHKDFPVIVVIRDLRAAIVSLANYSWDLIEETIGPSSLDQKITFLLETKNGGSKGEVVVVKLQAKAILNIFKRPQTLIVRFEDIVGSKGGGNDDLQRKTIQSIANHIKIKVSQERLNLIQAVLFGNTGISSSTFFTGQIDAWRESFTEKHHQIFNKRYGSLQKAFGYSLD
jgi:hypothetical protein